MPRPKTQVKIHRIVGLLEKQSRTRAEARDMDISMISMFLLVMIFARGIAINRPIEIKHQNRELRYYPCASGIAKFHFA